MTAESTPPPASGPGLEPVFEVVVELGEPLDFGETRDGRRRFTPVVGGALRGIAGPSASAEVRCLRAAVLAGGGDRQLVRPDGSVEIDARYDARADSGALLSLRAVGLRRPLPGGPYFRVAMRFEASEPALAELQDALYIADGVREASRVVHTVYRVS